MKRKMTIAVLLVYLAFSQSAMARIGETASQCKQHYGKPIREKRIDKDNRVYSYYNENAKFLILVHFFKGIADGILFAKCDRWSFGLPDIEDILGNFQGMSGNEINNLLKANGGGRGWRQRDFISLDKVWYTDDGSLTASYDITKHFLVIITNEYIGRAAVQQKAKDERNLGDF